jgi:hypothetical protein
MCFIIINFSMAQCSNQPSVILTPSWFEHRAIEFHDSEIKLNYIKSKRPILRKKSISLFENLTFSVKIYLMSLLFNICYLMLSYSGHSIIICFIVKKSLHLEHLGNSFLVSLSIKKPCVRRV